MRAHRLYTVGELHSGGTIETCWSDLLVSHIVHRMKVVSYVTRPQTYDVFT